MVQDMILFAMGAWCGYCFFVYFQNLKDKKQKAKELKETQEQKLPKKGEIFFNNGNPWVYSIVEDVKNGYVLYRVNKKHYFPPTKFHDELNHVDIDFFLKYYTLSDDQNIKIESQS